jgi:RNA polymerase sigma-70 factor, ECF subfamily
MDPTALEAEIAALAQASETSAAAAALIRGYGPEIWTYLASVLRAPDDDLADAFAVFCEDVCRGLPGFRFASSVRTWAYVIARRAALRHLRDADRRARRLVGEPALEAIAAEVRSTTAQHLRTTNHDRLAAARDQLDHDERTLLLLRVDRQLPWREIAQVMADDELTGDALRRREQVLRKKFELLKRQLRAKLAAKP